jgi:hypothetical protein
MTAAEMIAKEPEAMRNFLSEQSIGGFNRSEEAGSDFPLLSGHRETT